METFEEARRNPPKAVRESSLGDRIRWARKTAGFSHDRLVGILGRSNRGHLIKIEQGTHVPKRDLRNAIADATNVPRELFGTAEDDEEAAPEMREAFLLFVDLMDKLGASRRSAEASA